MIQEELRIFMLEVGSFLNNIFSMPSQFHPFFSTNLVLVLVSALFGYFYGKNAFPGFKTLTMVILTILFFGFMKFMGVG